MTRLTIRLDDRTAEILQAAVKESGLSQSRWIAEAIRQRARTEWPPSVRALAGAWHGLPRTEQIRKGQSPNQPRERF